MLKTRKTIIIFITLLIINILIVIKLLNKNTFLSNVEKVYKIILWTKYYSDDWPASLNQQSCSYTNCIFTQNREDFDSSEAVLFHWRDILVNDLPRSKLSSQKWILFNMEAPPYTYMGEPQIISNIDMFQSIDWIMSYRTDSDIYSPYGRLERCQRVWKPRYQFENKRKPIAWIASHCDTSSKRELVVEKLKKFLDIDVYGDCGRMKCAKNESCLQMIEQNYKFYLSFENSLCKDYVTEKLFRALQYDIIPIVFGSANYSSILVPNSYIDVFNFSNVPKLIEYLNKVMADKELYESYFQWKNNFCVQRLEDNTFCKICEQLNKKNKNYERKWDSSLVQWWLNEGQCKAVNFT